MSLEERVRVVEQDVTAARAEARGWGEFAMQANNKVDGMNVRFDRIETRLDGMDGTLKWHGEMLKVHDDHFGKLEAMLQAHDQRFDRVDATLAEHGSLLAGHGTLLREILARLDAPRS